MDILHPTEAAFSNEKSLGRRAGRGFQECRPTRGLCASGLDLQARLWGAE